MVTTNGEDLGELAELPPEIREKLEQLAPQQPHLPPRVQELPQVHLLMSLQKNLFCDAAFQAMALAIIGTVFKNNPDLNNPDLYVNKTFSSDDNADWSKYTCNCKPVFSTALSNLPVQMQACMDDMAAAIRKLINTHKIVMGTLRAYAHYNPQQVTGNFTVALIWIEENEDE